MRERERERERATTNWIFIRKLIKNKKKEGKKES